MWNCNNPAARMTVLALFVLLAVGETEAATYYVRKSGRQKNSGTSPSSAWSKIESATAVAIAGDTVYVGAGSYIEKVQPANSGTADSPIRFIADTDGSMTGDAGDVVTVGHRGYSLDVDGKDYVHVLGFKITGNDDGVRWHNSVGGLLQDCHISCQGNGVTVDTNSTLTVSKSALRANGGHGICVNGSVTDTDLIVSGCAFTNNGDAAIGFPSGPWNNVTVTVQNCLIHDNFARGIDIADQSTGLSVTVWNTTVARNALSGVEQDGAALTIVNSIIAFNSDRGLLQNGGTMTHAFNLVFGNIGGDFQGTPQDSTEVSADPSFVNVHAFDYHLARGSPAVDAGTDAAGIVDHDLDGNPRPIGDGWDLGCHESPFTAASTGGWRILRWLEIDKPSG